MKKHIRTIDMKDELTADRMKEKLRELGFYVLSGQGNNLEVYAISGGDDYIEQKVTKVIDKIVAKYGGTVVYSQWAPIMKRILCSISLVGALLLSGCTQWKRLTNSDTPKDPPPDIHGAWSAQNVTLGATVGHFDFIFIQNGSTITNESLVYADAAGISGHVSGSISGSDFSLTIDEGTLCVNKMHVDGAINGGQLSVHVTAAGNNIPGTACWPSAIDVTATMTR